MTTLAKAIRELYITNLAVKKDERALVLTDTLLPEEDINEADRKRRDALPDLARKVAKAGKERCQSITFLAYPSLKSHGSEPPKEIWAAAFGKKTVEKLEEYGLIGKLISKGQLSQKEAGDIKRGASVTVEFLD